MITSRQFFVQAATALVAATAFGALSGCNSSDASPMPETPTSTTPAAPLANVTAVMVHGAWADGSAWQRVTPILQARGVKVVSVQLHLTSLSEDASIVRRALEGQSGKVVLVGHSYGGAVITEAGTDPKVNALVYVGAFAPGDGESISDLISPYPALPWQAALIPDSAGYLRLSQDAYQNYFANDLPKAESAALETAQAPTHGQVLYNKVTDAAWKTKPSYWALSPEDHIIPAAFQQGEAARIKAKVTTITGGGHTEMLSHPQDVANVILDAAASLQ
jgi:pimeloyl-ACP methyl ester carboxylesterase